MFRISSRDDEQRFGRKVIEKSNYKIYSNTEGVEKLENARENVKIQLTRHLSLFDWC